MQGHFFYKFLPPPIFYVFSYKNWPLPKVHFHRVNFYGTKKNLPIGPAFVHLSRFWWLLLNSCVYFLISLFKTNSAYFKWSHQVTKNDQITEQVQSNFKRKVIWIIWIYPRPRHYHVELARLCKNDRKAKQFQSWLTVPDEGELLSNLHKFTL